MNQKQTRIAIIVVTIVIALFFLFSRKGSASTLVNNQDAPPIEVSIPSLSIPNRSITVNVPGLPTFTPYAYSPVSPCMCNGAALSQGNNEPLVEIVNNQGNQGPNIYNYDNSTPTDTGFTGTPYTGPNTGYMW